MEAVDKFCRGTASLILQLKIDVQELERKLEAAERKLAEFEAGKKEAFDFEAEKARKLKELEKREKELESQAAFLESCRDRVREDREKVELMRKEALAQADIFNQTAWGEFSTHPVEGQGCVQAAINREDSTPSSSTKRTLPIDEVIVMASRRDSDEKGETTRPRKMPTSSSNKSRRSLQKGIHKMTTAGEASQAPPLTMMETIFRFTNPTHSYRWAKIQHLPIIPTATIDWQDLESNPGWKEAVWARLDRAGMCPLFELQEDALEYPLKEFLCTFEVDDDCGQQDNKAISFHLGGKPRTMSYDGLAKALGFYTDDDQLQQKYEWVNDRKRAIMRDANMRFWATIAPEEGFYDCSCSTARMVEDPVLRFLHIVFSQSITDRISSRGRITAKDLVLFRCMAEGKRVHLGQWVVKLFQHQVKHCSRKLMGGTYVTKLAKHFECLEAFGPISAQSCVPMVHVGMADALGNGIEDLTAERCEPFCSRRGKGAGLADDVMREEEEEEEFEEVEWSCSD